VILVVTYVSVGTAVVAFGGLEALAEYDDDEAIFGVLAGDVLGSPLDNLVLLAIVTSAIASTQTTIIPASRTALSMARSDAFPSVLAEVHERFRTPHISTALVALLAVLWYVPANFISQNFLFDSLTALGLMIAFYYALSGIACAVYYRYEITKSAKNFLLMGVGPAVGATMLGYLFVEATRSFADVEESYSGQTILGLAPPLAIGYGFLLVGVVLVAVWRLLGHERFFGRRAFESVDPEVAAGRMAVAETVGLES
jgi:amino acid transporter